MSLMRSRRRVKLWASVLGLLAAAAWLWLAVSPSLPATAPSSVQAENPAAAQPGEPAPVAPAVRSSPAEIEAAQTSEPAGPGETQDQAAPRPEPGTAAPQSDREDREKEPTVSGPRAAKSPAAAAVQRAKTPESNESVTAAVAVVGGQGELLFGPAEVKIDPDNPWGATALGALEATGLPYQMSARFPELVETIAGQSNRGASGWMYQVNGEVPMLSAARHPVRHGDRIIWWYSRDLAQPPPAWEALTDEN